MDLLQKHVRAGHAVQVHHLPCGVDLPLVPPPAPRCPDDACPGLARAATDLEGLAVLAPAAADALAGIAHPAAGRIALDDTWSGLRFRPAT